MLYNAYEFQRAWLASASAFAAASAEWLGNPANPLGYLGGGPYMAAALDVFAHAAAPRGKPEFGLATTRIKNRDVPVREEIVHRKPFGQLKRFVRDGWKATPNC